MPMPALARFADVADLLRSRLSTDEVLIDLCLDNRLAYETLTRLKWCTPVGRVVQANSSQLSLTTEPIL